MRLQNGPHFRPRYKHVRLACGALLTCAIFALTWRNLVFLSSDNTDNGQTSIYHPHHYQGNDSYTNAKSSPKSTWYLPDPTQSKPGRERGGFTKRIVVFTEQEEDEQSSRLWSSIQPRKYETALGGHSGATFDEKKDPRNSNSHSFLDEREAVAEEQKGNQEEALFDDTCANGADNNINNDMDQQAIIFHPVCNLLHELPMQWESGADNNIDISLLSIYGTWRSAWLLEELNAQRLVVLKMLHLARPNTASTFYKHQRDAIFMDILQSSPYVVQEFGYCGHSTLVDYARRDGLFLRHKIQQSTTTTLQNNKKPKQTVPWKRRLLLARDLASGLSDIHAMSMAHGDVKLVNTILVNKNNNQKGAGGGGNIQWNDFNFGIFLSKNQQQTALYHSSCGVPARSNDGVWRCPEELYSNEKDFLDQDSGTTGAKHTSTKRQDINQEENHPVAFVRNYDKCDVFMFGNLMIELLTGQEPWYYDRNDEKQNGTLSEIEIRRLKYQGVKPTIPILVGTAMLKGENATTNNQPNKMGRKDSESEWTRTIAMTALVETMELCFARDPKDRPTALQLASALNASLEILTLGSDHLDEYYNSTGLSATINHIRQVFQFET